MQTSAQVYSRESLLADWQAIGATQTLTDQLQELILIFMNKPRTHVVTAHQIESPSTPSETESTQSPPPQRFQRRRSSLSSQRDPPAGPSSNAARTAEKTRLRVDAGGAFDCLLSAPQGPFTDANSVGYPDELNLAFEAVHK